MLYIQCSIWARFSGRLFYKMARKSSIFHIGILVQGVHIALDFLKAPEGLRFKWASKQLKMAFGNNSHLVVEFQTQSYFIWSIVKWSILKYRSFSQHIFFRNSHKIRTIFLVVLSFLGPNNGISLGEHGFLNFLYFWHWLKYTQAAFCVLCLTSHGMRNRS